ncbi:hypothetical protein AAG570_009843 [Ranatra chinensis]|uniref:Uncharacterized protein n=1 Tax=Ranatra chinensis TaxID=642074 RepID=A0ABD0YQA2_9HEMI
MEPSDPDCVESSSPFKTTDDWRHKLAGLQRSESDSCPSTDISLIEWGLPKDFGDVESEAPSSTWGLDPNLTLNEHLLSSVPSPASDNLDTIPPGSDHDLTLGINDVDFGAEFSDIFNSTCASENFEEDSSNEQNEPFGPVLPVDTNNNGINYDHLYDSTNDKKSGHCSLDKKEVGSNEHKTLLSEHSEFLTALAEVKCSLSEIEQTVAVWQCVAAMADSKRAFELMERVRTLCKTLRWIIGQNRRRSRLQTEVNRLLLRTNFIKG